MTHIAIAVPSLGTHESNMSMSLAANALTNANSRIVQSLLGWETASIAGSRNDLVQQALDAAADCLLWWDSDVVAPAGAVLRLLSHKKDIAGATYPNRTPPHALEGKPLDPDAQSGLIEFEHMPSGFMLVKMDVYRAIPRPWYFETYAYQGDLHAQIEALLGDTFQVKVPASVADAMGSAEAFMHWEYALKDQLTQKRSEDTNFCMKARRHGFQIWGDIDLTRAITHVGKHGVSLGDSQ